MAHNRHLCHRLMVAFPCRGDDVRRPYYVPDFIGAVLFMAIGIVVSLEANRLQAYSISQYVGDHTLPTILGILFVLLGGVLLIQSFRTIEKKKEKGGTKAPPAPERSRLILCLAALFLYCWLLYAIGYLPATLIVSAALFRLIGSYRWMTAVAFAVLLTGSLYAVFIWWLQITFPTGSLF